MTIETGYILEHRETCRWYRPVGCLHVFKTIEAAMFYCTIGFGGDAADRWRVLRGHWSVDEEVGEAELAEALERMKHDGKTKITKTGT